MTLRRMLHQDPPPRPRLGAVSEMRDRMRAGRLYRADDPQLTADHLQAQRILARYNATAAEETTLRESLLRELLGHCGTGVVIRPPLLCDYGQYLHIGDHTFVNFDAVLLDVRDIRIGKHCQIGPRVQILTATHPVEPGLRRDGWESGEEVHIGDNVWIGAGVIVLPGISIGDNSVVGAGAVVSRDLPADCVAVGSPARVIRRILDDGRATARPG